MGGNAGDHPHGDPLRTVHQKVGKPDRKYLGLLFRLVKVGDKVHHVLIQVCQERLLGHLGKPGLRISHGGSPVSLNGSEIPVAVHQGQSLFKLLGHDHQRLVDGAVPMGMVFTHGISHNTGALAVWLIVSDAKLVHVVERPSLHRL